MKKTTDDPNQRFNRLEILVGPDGLEKLCSTSIAVVGIGGVGSFAVEALARSGIGRLTLIDFDTICITNVNRQIHAHEGTIGRPKVQVMADRCRSINPHIEVEPVMESFNRENAAPLLDRGFDYVLDCIDNITSKLYLIETCRKKGIRIISSMGAANKLDPTAIQVADLSKTHKCRMARVVRKELRRRGISSGVKVVYSTEEFRPILENGKKTTTAVEETRTATERTRKPTLGTSSYVPPIFGLTMAGEILRELLEDF